MNDKQLEELSALMDGEASELEVRRVLGNLEQDQALCQKWARYQLTSSILKGETQGRAMHWRSVDLSARVAQALEVEPVLNVASTAGKRAGAAWLRPLANVAVAASVSAVVILGWQGYQGRTQAVSGPVALTVSSATGVSAGMPMAGNGLMPVSQGSSPVRSVSAIPRQDIIRYNPDVDDQLNEYLISHSSNAAMHTANGVAPYARVVALKPVKPQLKAEK